MLDSKALTVCSCWVAGSQLSAVRLCSPPEELVMPEQFPRSPGVLFSSLFSPLAWAFGRPDLFDSYSAGVIFMQLAGGGPVAGHARGWTLLLPDSR